jgi:hypothetical protein
MRNAFVCLLLLAAPALAQDVQLNGVIEPVEVPAICPGPEYVIASTGILLDDGGVDLAPYVGDIVHLDALDVTGACSAKILQVTAVAPPTATLEACGVPRPGCPMRLRVGPQTISQNLLAASLGDQGFLHLGDPLGVLFLQSPIIVLGSAGPGGIFDVTVPMLSPLGASIQLQGLHIETGPITGQLALSNPIALQLVFGPACIDPGSCGF